MKNVLTPETMKKGIKVVSTVVIVGLLIKIGTLGWTARTQYKETRKAAICPGLFSISRSARDTLIVMKAEPLCDDYMLDNLK